MLKFSPIQIACLLRGSGMFDGRDYLKCYPDVADAGMDPFEHYARFGHKEGRNLKLKDKPYRDIYSQGSQEALANPPFW